MYKNSTVLSEKMKILQALNMENMCDANGFYWFTFLFYNALFKMDKETWKAQYVCSFPEEIPQMRMYSKIIHNKMKLYCIPLSANSIGIYDMVSNECISIKIEEPKRKGEIIYKENSKFIDAICDDNYLYLLPHTYPAVVRMRFSDNRVDYFYKPLIDLEILNKSAKEQPDYYFGKFTHSGENNWVFSYASGKICRFLPADIKFEQCNYIQIKGQAVLVSEFHYIWIFSILDSMIYKLNLKTGNYIEISEFPKDFNPGSTSLTRGILYGNYVFFLPGTANKSIKIDIKTNEISLAEEFCPEVTEMFLEKEIWKFRFLECLDEKLYAFDASDNRLVEYNMQNKKIRKQEITIDFLDRKTKKWMDDYFWFTESNLHRVRNLNSLLKLLVEDAKQLERKKEKDNCLSRDIGRRIYREIIKE